MIEKAIAKGRFKGEIKATKLGRRPKGHVVESLQSYSLR